MARYIDAGTTSSPSSLCIPSSSAAAHKDITPTHLEVADYMALRVLITLFRDILQLKEIQFGLPGGIYPADLIKSRARSHYLSAPPTNLLAIPQRDTSPRATSP
ncbi:hypothetical protein NP233_g3907 [Leucocoprinus birnbaumii]|uniref:Uncharacterized protein n=1 Tax=Leucocoprinus birnbaumii TaxID=56174 RepID=A0AAD5VX47_9AGAR|nr:hypothetical protein NP233_g3907 [Leucocoprinus birnbaumii]